MKIAPYLKILAEKGGSGLYLFTDAVPGDKFNGVLTSPGRKGAVHAEKQPGKFGGLSLLEHEQPEQDQQAAAPVEGKSRFQLPPLEQESGRPSTG